MGSLKVSARLSFALGLLSLLAVFVSVLALQDVYHGESDLTNEWRALRVSALIILMFQASALPTLLKVARRG